MSSVMTEQTLVPVEAIAATILTIRVQRVILDSDLARIYGVTIRQLNQAVKRNPDRFPLDFMFQLTKEEHDSLRSQIVTLKMGRGQHRKYLPHAFTEHGALMAASVLNSPKAVEVSVFVVRAFIQQRAMLASNADLSFKLLKLEKNLLASMALTEDRLDDHESQLEQIVETIRDLRTSPDTPRRPIGFRAGDDE